jgi:alkanesulfonate monooxygenase SsuD/methylene tetrahydromethanopterin reductase-like flavin-dependent oxidoreductase (luciferase family)
VAESDAEAAKNIGQIKLDMYKLFNINQAVVDAVSGNRPEMREIERPFLCGGPTTVLDQIGELREAGVGNMDMSFTWPTVSHTQRLRSMEITGKSVLPQIRAL